MRRLAFLDALFGPWRWWRRWRGGVWIQVENPAAMIWDCWVRPPALSFERETAREVWT